jgi:hypothetical protein
MHAFEEPYILYYSANLIFIFTALVCALVRWGHTCPEFSHNIEMHYPARKISIVFCFLFMLEFPYLLNVRSTDALLYANVYSMLFYPIMVVMMAKRYFFYVKYPVKLLL